MECPRNETLTLYLEGALNPLEAAMIRDHLIDCAGCRSRLRQYQLLESSLVNPPMIPPPACIEKSVMRKLFPVLPTYGSVFAFVTASFLLLITWVYVYFDFANNSLVQAMQITSNRLFRFAGQLIQAISTVFSAVYASFRAISKLVSAVVNVQLHTEIVLFLTLIIAVGPIWALVHALNSRRRKQGPSRVI